MCVEGKKSLGVRLGHIKECDWDIYIESDGGREGERGREKEREKVIERDRKKE